MVKEIEPKLEKIQEYLMLEESEKFVIPAYQRAYSWNNSQCEELWQDIQNYIDNGGKEPYFFGTVIIDFSDNENLQLIDGQQRTTTFLLLLKALYFAIENELNVEETEDNKKILFSLDSSKKKIIKILFQIDDEIPLFLDNPKDYKTNLLENNSINEKYPDELNKIINSNSFDEAKSIVSTIPRKQKDNKYTNHFRNFKYFYEKASELHLGLANFTKKFLENCQIIQIKSWQTEQAVEMFNSLNSSGLPLRDADIISAKLYGNANDRESFQEVWKNIINLSEQLSQTKVVNIDTILAQNMYILRANEKISDVKVIGLRRFYNDERKELLKNPEELCDNLNNLVQIWNVVKDKEVVKLALKFNENIKWYLAGYFSRFDVNHLDFSELEQVTKVLVRLFALLELSGTYSTSTFKSFLFKMNIKFVDKSISIKEIENDFDEHIRKNWKKEDVKEDILEYQNNILVFLNEYLYAIQKGKSFHIFENTQIEHILPSSGKHTEAIRISAGLTEEEFSDYVNNLGNKILLESTINIPLSNAYFDIKKIGNVDSKNGYNGSQFAIAQDLVNYPKNIWGKEEIINTTDKIAERLIKFIFND